MSYIFFRNVSSIAVLLVRCGSANAAVEAFPVEPQQKAPAPALAKPAAAPGNNGTKAAATTAVPPAGATAATPAGAAPTISDDMQVVSVVGERSTNRIDRQVYDIKNNPSTANASIGDILNNVPAVTVDADGKVALRGDDKVTIMVDGKRVQQFDGENRAPAINSTAAAQYESVQVINNPGAEFGTDGGGGPIINLISRRYQTPGGSGFGSATAGVSGRHSGMVSGRSGWGFASLEGNASTSRTRDNRSSRTDSENFYTDGTTNRHSDSRSATELSFSRIGSTLRYNLNARDSLAAILNYNSSTTDSRSSSHNVFEDPRHTTLRPLGGRQENVSDNASTSASTGHEAGVAWERKEPSSGDAIKLDFRSSYTQRTNESASEVTDIDTTIARINRDNRTRRNTTYRLLDLSGAYEASNAWGFSSTGFKVTNSVQAIDTYAAWHAPGSSVDVVNADQTNRFVLEERVLALYGTHEWRLNPLLSVKAGLRGEHTEIAAEHVTHQSFGDNHYMNWLPSAYASYKLGKASTVRLQYARRIQRPQPNDLDPYVRKYGDYYESSGNPLLLPMKTDSLEAQYETTVGGWRADLKAFVRRESDVIMAKSELIGIVTRSTRENAGSRDNVGLEYSLRGKIIPTLQLSLTGNLRRYEQLVYRIGQAPMIRRADAFEPRLGLTYDYDPENQFTGTLTNTARRVFGDTVMERTERLDLSWSHRVDKRIRMNVRISDALESVSPRRVTESTQIRSISEDKVPGRIFYVGISMPIGGVTGNAAVRSGAPGLVRPAGAPLAPTVSRP